MPVIIRGDADPLNRDMQLPRREREREEKVNKMIQNKLMGRRTHTSEICLDPEHTHTHIPLSLYSFYPNHFFSFFFVCVCIFVCISVCVSLVSFVTVWNVTHVLLHYEAVRAMPLAIALR